MIIGPDIPDPTSEDILSIDDILSDQGIPVFRRPIEGAKIWGERHGGMVLGLNKEAIFRDAYRHIHPSVPFGSDSFLTLCVSARGISYFIKPPMGYGRIAVRPKDHITITDDELGRLYHRHPAQFFELMWQGFDAIDLFMALVNFHPQGQSAQNMMGTAVNQLTASARQLVACEIDASLPQGMALACELAGKAVLLHCSYDTKKLKGVGHNLSKLVQCIRETGALPRSPAEAQIDLVVDNLPRYVDVRYSSPPMTILVAQDYFRKSMFFIADLLRQTNHDQLYWKVLDDSGMPNRSFSTW